MKKFTSYSLLFLLFFVLLSSSCKGQKESTSQPAAAPLSYYTTQTRVANYVRNIQQDKNGHLWFGTNEFGVAHFNGDSLLYFSFHQGFNGQQITGMTQDLEKNLWFATDKGLVKYDWKVSENGKKVFTNGLHINAFNPGSFWSIFSDSKGTIWIGTRKGVFYLNGTSLVSFELPFSEEYVSEGFFSNQTIWSITEDEKGNLWFGTNGNGAFKYDGKQFTQYTKKDGLADNSVDHIMEDRNGNIWFGTRNGGISRFDGKSFLNFTENDLIGSNEVCSIYEDRAGNIWFSSEGYGVYRYEPSKNSDGSKTELSNYGEEQGLGIKAVQTIFEDSKGQLWVGGGGGLYRFEIDRFVHVGKNGPWEKE